MTLVGIGLVSCNAKEPQSNCGGHENGCAGRGAGGATNGGSGGSAGGATNDGSGGNDTDRLPPEERALRFCPDHGETPECEDGKAYYQYEAFEGCGLRYVRKVDDLLEEEAYFVDLATDEIVYRAHFTEEGRCLVALDETGGLPTCDDFTRESCEDFTP
jgi:hypothetical protein